MTDYESMDARQIDALIAERMGRTVEWLACLVRLDEPEPDGILHGLGSGPCIIISGEKATPVAFYSTDWRAAGEVVEALGKLHGLRVNIICEADDRAASALVYDRGDISEDADAESVPLAICLAALRALDAREGK